MAGGRNAGRSPDGVEEEEAVKLHVSSRITVRVSAKMNLKPQWRGSEPGEEEKGIRSSRSCTPVLGVRAEQGHCWLGRESPPQTCLGGWVGSGGDEGWGGRVCGAAFGVRMFLRTQERAGNEARKGGNETRTDQKGLGMSQGRMGKSLGQGKERWTRVWSKTRKGGPRSGSRQGQPLSAQPFPPRAFPWKFQMPPAPLTIGVLWSSGNIWVFWETKNRETVLGVRS